MLQEVILISSLYNLIGKSQNNSKSTAKNAKALKFIKFLDFRLAVNKKKG